MAVYHWRNQYNSHVTFERIDDTVVVYRERRQAFRIDIPMRHWQDIVAAILTHPPDVRDYPEYRWRNGRILLIVRWEQQGPNNIAVVFRGLDGDGGEFNLLLPGPHWRDILDYMAVTDPVDPDSRMALLMGDEVEDVPKAERKRKRKESSTYRRAHSMLMQGKIKR